MSSALLFLLHSFEAAHPSHIRADTVAMDLFRAASAAREHSERVMHLTATILKFNMGHYSVWCASFTSLTCVKKLSSIVRRLFRRRCLLELGLSIKDELQFTAKSAGENPKNYQMWFHRRELCASNHKLLTGEIAYTTQVLSKDPKNYHAWSHRQWAVAESRTFEDDNAFTDSLLEKDGRNNSAWNHKWFLLSRGGASALSRETIIQELANLKQHVTRIPSNEAAWNFFQGLLQQAAAKDLAVLSAAQDMHASAQANEPDAAKSNAAYPLAGKLYILELQQAVVGDDVAAAHTKVCQQLCVQDPIRKRYWEHRGTMLAT